MIKKIDEKVLDLQLAYLKGLASGFPDTMDFPTNEAELKVIMDITKTIRHIAVLEHIKTLLY